MYVRKDLNILNIIDSGVIYFNAALFMFIIGFIIGKLLTPSLLTMFIQVIVCAIIYLIILIVIKDELIIGIKKRVFKTNAIHAMSCYQDFDKVYKELKDFLKIR